MSRAAKKALRIAEHGAYRSWRNMRDRCLNLNREKSYNYAAKGITCCDRWVSFELFLEDMGSRPEGFTLERRDNSKGYEPSNCRWATTIEQNRNTTQNVINFEMAVEIASLRLAGMAHTEIGRRFGVNKMSREALCVAGAGLMPLQLQRKGVKQMNNEPVPPAGGEVEVLSARQSFDAWFTADLGLPAHTNTAFVGAAAEPWRAWKACSGVYIANITRLQAENAALQQRLNTADQRVDELQSESFEALYNAAIEERDAAQSELTKARELIVAQGKVIELAKIIDKQAFAKGTQNVGVVAFRAMGDALVELAHQSAPAAKYDCCANCMRPKAEHNGRECPAPYTTVWDAWDYNFPPENYAPAATGGE